MKRTVGLGLALIAFLAARAGAADLADTQKLLNTGQYAQCIESCKQAIASRQWDENWWLLKTRAELASGRYDDALETVDAGVDRFETSARLRLLAYDVYRLNNKPDEAIQQLLTLRALASRAPWRYSDAPSRVALGRAFMRLGADARQILELFFDQARKQEPTAPDSYMASGELALLKNDYALAAEAFQNAIKHSGDDPDAYFGLAQSFPDDSKRTTAALNKALELNPKHADSLLYQADNLIDQEGYEQAESVLKTVLETNPKHPKAWAYRAVLAHLAAKGEQEKAHREKALAPWPTNPEVDHLIGQKLSQNYRFDEGATYQRQALGFDPSYQPAKAQLAQDLLRLGLEDEGWKLAAEVFKEDPYNVLAFNLVTLRDNLAKFRPLTDKHFLVRMDEREATIYGQRAQRLLERAREKLTTKYGVELPDAITVEIFPQQKDFAIRTFGMPGGAGFLGVCFGNVVTVNSPASRGGNPSNWEAVLWHEFCHVITLHKTRNKMPRWLSEGISVYEERQEVPAWGQSMNPRYRELVLKGGATPVSKLSSAFLKPPTPMHLQFAYYESSMVVDYVIGRFGVAALQKVLSDLGEGVAINDALAKNTEPIGDLDKNFEKWFREQAQQLGKPPEGAKIDWERPELPLDAGSAAMAAWNKEHPNSFYGLLGEGRALVAEQKWQEAKAPLEKAAALYPACGDAGGPYVLLAAVYRELKDPASERQMLEKHAALDADAIEPRLRLIELAAGQKDWEAVRKGAEQVLAINPLTAAPHRYLAQAAEALADRASAIEAQRTLLLLDPLDRSEHHYRLARLLVEEKQLPDARRQAVMALEEAPRYRDAQRLLLQIVAKMEKEKAPASAPAAPTAPANEEDEEP
jgi:tetratricopeptide (TPR) repeat protein